MSRTVPVVSYWKNNEKNIQNFCEYFYQTPNSKCGVHGSHFNAVQYLSGLGMALFTMVCYFYTRYGQLGQEKMFLGREIY